MDHPRISLSNLYLLKDFEPHKKDQNKVESHHERNVREEKRMHVFSMLLRPGMTLFEYNKKTHVLRKADIVTSTVEVKMDDKPTAQHPGVKHVTRKRVDDKDNCFYFQKLNFKNAVRFLMKQGIQEIYIDVE